MIRLKNLNLPQISLIITFIYGIYNGALGFYFRSYWFLTIFAYYIILGVMRLAVLRSAAKETKESDQIFITKFIGGLFIFLSITLAGAAYLSVLKDRGTVYHQIVMITIALYTFIKITVAIINLIKARKGENSIIKTLRYISFADALVSIFSLQRSMLVSFEGMEKQDIILFNILTGTAVYLIVFVMGINLIGGKKYTMAKSKIINANKKIADGVVDGYKKIEKGVVDGYKKIEKGVVSGYTKIEDKFVDMYLTHDGESIKDAKKRLKNKDNK